MPVNMKAILKNARVRTESLQAPAPEAPAPAPEEEAPAPEWSMNNTKAELIEAAESAGVEFKSTWSKSDILAALLG